MKKTTLRFISLCILGSAGVVVLSAQTACDNSESAEQREIPDVVVPQDTLMTVLTNDGDTLALAVEPALRSGRLTEQDYIEVAKELGVEVPAIKAVVEIEAGKAHKGFWAEGKPIINFDLSVYQQAAKRHHVNLAQARKTHPVIFAGPNAKKYGSQQAGQQARLDAAREINSAAGIEGTFWGMFQLGGFNWKKCGTDSPEHFVDLMSRSERDQLELFATFIKNSGMLKSLQDKNWAAFARRYNGASYAKRGYHTRMAKAYAKYKSK